MTKEQLESLVKKEKETNKKGWFNRVTESLLEKGYEVTEFEICSNGHHSGEVRKKGNQLQVFNWGRGVKARSGFNYNIYPVIAIEI